MKCLLIAVLLFSVSVSMSFCGKLIGTATLHITLYVPPKPITIDTCPGEYEYYSVERIDDTMLIAAK